MLFVDAPIDPVELTALVDGTSTAVGAYDTIDAVGPDTQKFLHSLLSQDIAAMVVGESRWSFLLQPQGKLVALLHVTRSGDETFVLRTNCEVGAPTLSILTRYRIRTKCELTLREAVPTSVAFVRGIPVLSEAIIADVPKQELLDTALGLAAWPSHPYELDDTTIPNETGILDYTVNFKKGCYVGQELVERIASRAVATPHRLARVTITDASWPSIVDGTVSLFREAKNVGTLTSVVRDLRSNEFVGMAYVARSVEDGELLVVAPENDPGVEIAKATVHAIVR